jgi:hypothetical protein
MAMKKLLVLVLALAVLSPTLAFAGGSTDAALALGAFAVFNQIISGTGVFGGFRTAYPPVYPLPAPVIVAPPPPVVFAPPPQVVVVRPPVAYYAPAPAYYYRAPHRVVMGRHGWCPPGRMKHGRCF